MTQSPGGIEGDSFVADVRTRQAYSVVLDWDAAKQGLHNKGRDSRNHLLDRDNKLGAKDVSRWQVLCGHCGNQRFRGRNRPLKQ